MAYTQLLKKLVISFLCKICSASFRESLKKHINYFENIFHHILILVFLLLQGNIPANNISFDRPTRVLKADINTFQSDI
jgi:hypothetical protein